MTLSNLLNGKASLSPEMAIRFEKYFGVKAATMLRMQAAYDLSQASAKAKSIKAKRIADQLEGHSFLMPPTLSLSPPRYVRPPVL